MKTAVEELEEYLKWTGVVIERPDTRCILQEVINQAKKNEEQQILDAYVYGASYGIDINNNLNANKYYEERYKNK